MINVMKRLSVQDGFTLMKLEGGLYRGREKLEGLIADSFSSNQVVALRGLHDSGKSAVARGVVSRLSERGMDFKISFIISIQEELNENGILGLNDPRMRTFLSALRSESHGSVIDDWTTAMILPDKFAVNQILLEAAAQLKKGKKFLVVLHMPGVVVEGENPDLGFSEAFPSPKIFTLNAVLEPAAVRAFIEEGLSDTGISFSPRTMDEIILLSGGVPPIFRGMCQMLLMLNAGAYGYGTEPCVIDKRVGDYIGAFFSYFYDFFNSLKFGLTANEEALLAHLVLGRINSDVSSVISNHPEEAKTLLDLGIISDAGGAMVPIFPAEHYIRGISERRSSCRRGREYIYNKA